MTDKAKQQLIDDMLEQYQNRENEFAIINDDKYNVPVMGDKGTHYGYQLEEKYRGLALEINDHGNVTVWNVFKNGNRREVASRV